MATSQLCVEESWERVYLPPDLNPLRPPPSLTARCKEKLFASIRDRLSTTCYDIRDRHIARYTLCKERKSCSYKSIYQRFFFWKKAIVLVLLINALFSTAVHGVTTRIIQFVLGPDYAPIPLVVASCLVQLLFPIVGYVSDAYACRHKLLQFSLWCAWVSFAVIGVSFSLDSQKDGNLNAITKYAILPTTFVSLAVAFACFMSNVIPFALDQMQGTSHVHYSSLFYWWYWSLNIGIAMVHTPEYCSNKPELRFLIQVEIALVCVTIALILDTLFAHWLVIEPRTAKQESAILQICQVICYVFKPPANQRVPSSVQHELDLSSCNRLQLAKKRFGGKFETEQVENTRTFFYIILVIISIGFVLVPFFGVYDTVGWMEGHMKNSTSNLVIHWKVCDFKISALTALSPVLLLTLIPVLDLLVIPLLHHAMLHPTILKRLGIGAMWTLLSVLSVLALEAIGDRNYGVESDTCMMVYNQGRNKMSSYWLILPVTLVTIAEIFIYIPGFEFMSAQAPYNMRGFIVGIFFSVQGFFSLAALLIQHFFSWRMIHIYISTGYTCRFWYYLTLVCLSILSICCYLVVACKYRRRKRDDMFNQVGMIEEYFSTGRIHSSRWT